MAKNLNQSGLSEEEIHEFKEAFPLFDRDGDGQIGLDELRNIMRALGSDATDDELKDVIAEVDIEGRGALDFPSYLRMMFKMKPQEKEDEAKAIFSVFDRKGKGFISQDELAFVLKGLGENLTSEELADMISEADKDKDGKVGMEDFVEMMKLRI
eukprot:c8511_g1_i1.p1 GENE.c8511_g1_i1~~c8511_g1_i1.p1  ORF type:complete len:155 (+),score=48.47 c8511_g1_i1:39-503(+)